MNLDGAAAAQMPLIEAAWRFLRPFYGQGDLLGAWPNVHPTLRLCWVQWWLTGNRAGLEEDGFDLEEVAQALVETEPDHPLWDNFQRVLGGELVASIPVDVEVAGIGTGARPLGVDLEVLYVHPQVPPNGVWEDGAWSAVVPLVMQLVDDKWQVLNLGHEAVPVPGWPPQLWDGPSQ